MQVALDEGGIRSTDGSAFTYIPFAEIADVELVTRMLRAPIVSIELASGHKKTIFSGNAALEIHRAVAEHLEARRQRKSVQTVLRWQRNGRDLESWLADAKNAEGYRDESIAVALSIFEDADADIEQRAAAGWVLAHAGDAELLHVARAIASRPLPPLVLGVLGMATEDARAFLTEAMPAPSERLVTALERARAELADEASRQTTKHHARHRAVAGVDRNPSKWVGRTWGF